MFGKVPTLSYALASGTRILTMQVATGERFWHAPPNALLSCVNVHGMHVALMARPLEELLAA
jgi:hypothetical protein